MKYIEVEINTMVGDVAEYCRCFNVETPNEELTEKDVVDILNKLKDEWGLGECEYFDERLLEEKPARIDFRLIF